MDIIRFLTNERRNIKREPITVKFARGLRNFLHSMYVLRHNYFYAFCWFSLLHLSMDWWVVPAFSDNLVTTRSSGCYPPDICRMDFSALKYLACDDLTSLKPQLAGAHSWRGTFSHDVIGMYLVTVCVSTLHSFLTIMYRLYRLRKSHISLSDKIEAEKAARYRGGYGGVQVGHFLTSFYRFLLEITFFWPFSELSTK